MSDNDLRIEENIEIDGNDKNNADNTNIYLEKYSKAYDKSIHIHNPVPLSKLQKAENEYYKLKAEMEKKIFGKNFNDNPDIVYQSKKNQEMIAYLEQLNNVLSQIISNKRIMQKESNKSKTKTPNKTPEQIYQEQQKMIGNSEKLLEAYKKEYSQLQQKLDLIKNPEHLETLKSQLSLLDKKIEEYNINNRKLKNEQKLNEIAISKQNRGENKFELELKRLNMDYDNFNRQNEKFKLKINDAKRQEGENDIKIKQLNEFLQKLHTIAKDLYNITEYENVKKEEKNEKKNQEKLKNLQRNMEILEKKKESNKKKYEKDIVKNLRTINDLKKDKYKLEYELKQLLEETGNVKQIDSKFIEGEVDNLPEGNEKERAAILMEIEQKQKKREDLLNKIERLKYGDNEIENENKGNENVIDEETYKRIVNEMNQMKDPIKQKYEEEYNNENEIYIDDQQSESRKEEPGNDEEKPKENYNENQVKDNIKINKENVINKNQSNPNIEDISNINPMIENSGFGSKFDIGEDNHEEKETNEKTNKVPEFLEGFQDNEENEGIGEDENKENNNNANENKNDDINDNEIQTNEMNVENTNGEGPNDIGGTKEADIEGRNTQEKINDENNLQNSTRALNDEHSKMEMEGEVRQSYEGIIQFKAPLEVEKSVEAVKEFEDLEEFQI